MTKITAAIRAFLIASFAFALIPATIASDWDEQPSVKKSISPQNPENIEGMVMATINIDEKGFVVGAEIAKSTNNSLDTHVLEAVKDWRFNPAKKGGSPIACKINVPFKFKG